MIEILDREALLAELSFYLQEVDLSLLDLKNFISLVQEEYLLDYSFKLGNAGKEGNFIISNLKEKVKQQRILRFSEKN